jgi:hypothetical protein
MLQRRRVKHTESLKELLASFANDLRMEAERLPPGPERDNLLKRARLAETAYEIKEWVSSAGLQPPK